MRCRILQSDGTYKRQLPGKDEANYRCQQELLQMPMSTDSAALATTSKNDTAVKKRRSGPRPNRTTATAATCPGGVPIFRRGAKVVHATSRQLLGIRTVWHNELRV